MHPSWPSDDPWDDAIRAKDRGDYGQAFKIYENLAKDGHVYSLILLADMYAEGKGTEVNLSKAEELYDRAAGLGMSEAFLQKAYLFRDRGDMRRYFSGIQQATRMGLLPAQFRLGFCYARGRGIARDDEKALEVMREAAERGHIGAKIYIARRLLARPLDPIAFVRGLVLLLVAIAQGVGIALRNPYDDRVR